MTFNKIATWGLIFRLAFGPNAAFAGSSSSRILNATQVKNGAGAVNIPSSGTVSFPLSIGNGGTGQTAKTAAFDALSPNTTKGDITIHNGTNNVRQGIGSFGQVLTADSSQTTGLKWSTPSKGTKNYITTNADIEQNATTGFSLGHVALTNGLPSGSPTFGSGAAGTLSIAASGTSPIADSYSLTYVSSAATTAGDFVATDAFTIDPEGQAKALQFKISYQAAVNPSNGNFSGTSSNSFGVALYDATNSSFIPCSGAFNVVQSSGVGIATGTCQTAINTASARLLFYNVSASSGAITMKLDNWSYGPQVSSSGVPATDWASYSLTVGATTTPPTPGAGAIASAQWRRIGDSMEISYTYQQTAAGSNGTGAYLYPLPSVCTIDTTKVTAATTTATASVLNSGATAVGSGQYNSTTAAAANFWSPVVVSVYNSSNLVLSVSNTVAAQGYPAGSSAMNYAQNPLYYSFTAKVPCVGWSSNTVQSADSDQRVVALNARRAAAANHTSSGSFQTVVFDTVTGDTHGAYNSSTGVYTVPVTKWYRISSVVGFANSSTGIRTLNVYVTSGGVSTSYNIGNKDNPSGTAASLVAGSITLPLKAGDTVQIRAYQTSGGTLAYTIDTTDINPTVSIEGLSGSAVVQATETVKFRATGTSTTPTGSAANITFTTTATDSHGKWNGTTYTIPVPGFYRFVLSTIMTGTFALNTASQIQINQNGSMVDRYAVRAGGAVSNSDTMQLVSEFNCAAGDQITFQGLTAASGPGYADMRVMGERLGN